MKTNYLIYSYYYVIIFICMYIYSLGFKTLGFCRVCLETQGLPVILTKIVGWIGIPRVIYTLYIYIFLWYFCYSFMCIYIIMSHIFMSVFFSFRFRSSKTTCPARGSAWSSSKPSAAPTPWRWICTRRRVGDEFAQRLRNTEKIENTEKALGTQAADLTKKKTYSRFWT